MQDGAPAHRALPVRNRLQKLFGNRVVGMGHHYQIDWLARSPDLSPLDFYLSMGYSQEDSYRQSPPASLRQLRNRITDAFNEIRRTREVRRAVQHMVTRAQRGVKLQGGHVDERAGLQWDFILQHDMFNKTKRHFSEPKNPKRPFSGSPKNKREGNRLSHALLKWNTWSKCTVVGQKCFYAILLK